METLDIPKELGLFYVTFLNVPLYIQWDQFIIFQVTLPTPYQQVPSNFMLAFKRLCLNLLNIVYFLNLKVLETSRAGTYVAVHSLCSHSSDHRLKAQFEFSACTQLARTYLRVELSYCTFSLYGIHRIVSIYVVMR